MVLHIETSYDKATNFVIAKSATLMAHGLKGLDHLTPKVWEN